MSDISKKQLVANQQNSKLGGVKTTEGKEVSKYNAVKHSILTNVLSEDEARHADEFAAVLKDKYHPHNPVEEMLLERISIWQVRLNRAVLAENEKLKQLKNPRVIQGLDLELGTVVQEGYTPLIDEEAVQQLSEIYLRYETSIERNLIKAIKNFFDLRERYL